MKLVAHGDKKTCADCVRFKTCAPQIAHKGQAYCVYTPSRFMEGEKNK